MGAIALKTSTRPAANPHTLGRWIALGVGVTTAVVYLATLAPSLSFSHHGVDSGDLIAAARTLGVPHPTGYPTYTLLAWLFSNLPFGTPAYRVNLLSAACAAATAGILCRALQLHLPANSSHTLQLSVAAALSAAFAPLFWSQALIAEVYTLHALFSVGLIWILLSWYRQPRDGTLALAAFLFGLGLGNHVTLALALPAAALVLVKRRQAWFNIRTPVIALGAFLGGLAVYAYLPLAASRRPPVNWADPREWDRFVWLVTARPYQHLPFGLNPREMLGRAPAWAKLVGTQYGWWGLTLALAGLFRLWNRDRCLAGFTLLWSVAAFSYAFGYDSGDAVVYLVPFMLVMSLWWHQGASYLLELVELASLRWQGSARIALVALPLLSLGLTWNHVSLKDDTVAQSYAAELLETVEHSALVITWGDKPTFALWYAAYAENRRSDVAVVNGPLLAYDWYRATTSERYPQFDIPSLASPDASADDLVRALIVANYLQHPVYATDPSDNWLAWFEFVPQKSSQLFLVRPRIIWETG